MNKKTSCSYALYSRCIISIFALSFIIGHSKFVGAEDDGERPKCSTSIARCDAGVPGSIQKTVCKNGAWDGPSNRYGTYWMCYQRDGSMAFADSCFREESVPAGENCPPIAKNVTCKTNAGECAGDGEVYATDIRKTQCVNGEWEGGKYGTLWNCKAKQGNASSPQCFSAENPPAGVTCSNEKPACGYGDQKSFASEADIGDAGKCRLGTVQNFSSKADGWSWSCELNNGSSVSCSARKVSDITPQCGDGKPTLCTVGTASEVETTICNANGKWSSPTGEYGSVWKCLGPNEYRGKIESCFRRETTTRICGDNQGGNNGNTSSGNTGGGGNTGNLRYQWGWAPSQMKCTQSDNGKEVACRTDACTETESKNAPSWCGKCSCDAGGQCLAPLTLSCRDNSKYGGGETGGGGGNAGGGSGGSGTNSTPRYQWGWASSVRTCSKDDNGKEITCRTDACTEADSKAAPSWCGKCSCDAGGQCLAPLMMTCRDNELYGKGGGESPPSRGGDRGNFIEATYKCENGQGELHMKYHFSSGPYPPYEAVVMINNEGFVNTGTPPRSLSNFYVKGCGCPTALSGDQKFTSTDGLKQVNFRPKGNGIPESCTSSGGTSPGNIACGTVNKRTLSCDNFMNCLDGKTVCTTGTGVGISGTEPAGTDPLALHNPISSKNWVGWDWTCGKDQCIACLPGYRVEGNTCVKDGVGGFCPEKPKCASGEILTQTGEILEGTCYRYICKKNTDTKNTCGPANGKSFGQKPVSGLCLSGAKLSESVSSEREECPSPGPCKPIWVWKCDTYKCKAYDTSASGSNIKVTLTVSGSMLVGTLYGFEKSDTYGCFESVERSEGVNSNTYCSSEDGTMHWTQLTASGDIWKYDGGNWLLRVEIGNNSIFPEGNYRLYWKNKDGTKKISAKFQVLISQGVRIIGSANSASEYWKGNSPFITQESQMVGMRSKIVKNLASITRNMKEGELIDGVVWYDSLNQRLSLTKKGAKTIIVYGNLVIDEDIPQTLGIIVLKQTMGAGGNVIVEDHVRSIHGIIFAEGALRGTSENAEEKNPDLQLVLKGALFSRNTIGGSAFPEDLFVYPRVSTTNPDEAFIQDLNVLRSGNGGNTYLGTYIDAFIIDYDGSIVTNPPPVF